MAVAALIATLLLAAITAWYAWITHGLLREAQLDRARLLERDESDQARLIGGYVEAIHTDSGVSTLQLTIVNASPLPIRWIVGRARLATGAEVRFGSVPLIPGGRQIDVHETIADNLARGLFIDISLDFNDDNGQGWRKNEQHQVPLRKLTPGERVEENRIAGRVSTTPVAVATA